jgi:2-iminobutanoate/2-iminopropanoate deaminase
MKEGKKIVQTPHAPEAIGPYSQGVGVGDMVFFSGQVPLDPKSGLIVGQDISEQTTQVLKNIQGLLESQDLSVKNVVKTLVFLKNMKDFPVFNEIYGKFFEKPFPARSTVEVSALPKGALVEIECTAFRF